MSSRRWILAGILAAALAGGSAAALEDGDAAPQITGVVTYRERVALPPEATIQVRLEDASRPEMPGKLVAEVTISAQGRQVPIPFVLPYRAADISPNKKYLVRATVTAGDRTLFASRAAYPVITRGAPTQLEILVQQTGGDPKPRATPEAVPLEGTYWQLIELAGKPDAAAPGTRHAHVQFDAEKGSVQASTGCNSVGGKYERTEGRLRLTPGPMTMMACVNELMQQETAFLDAMRATTGYRITGDRLLLLDGERVLAQFEAARRADPTQAH